MNLHSEYGDKILCQAAVQTEEGDPDGDQEEQGNQRGVDASQQRAPAATEGQPVRFVCNADLGADAAPSEFRVLLKAEGFVCEWARPASAAHTRPLMLTALGEGKIHNSDLTWTSFGKLSIMFQKQNPSQVGATTNAKPSPAQGRASALQRSLKAEVMAQTRLFALGFCP